MPPSYAVMWRESDGRVCSGELALGELELRLEGVEHNGEPASRSVGYQEIAGARIGRSAGDRLDGRPTLVVELYRGPAILLTGAEGVALYHEIAERLTAALLDGAPA